MVKVYHPGGGGAALETRVANTTGAAAKRAIESGATPVEIVNGVVYKAKPNHVRELLDEPGNVRRAHQQAEAAQVARGAHQQAEAAQVFRIRPNPAARAAQARAEQALPAASNVIPGPGYKKKETV